ncbi:hypothetical protein CL176_02640 [Suicoccus acidiformans]|uniref:Uncharacterized protein n=1 Tax=Suicoccus acidiformans TaxID=2036206 RepID=A0A347WIV3_9LACT|nr:hypothetical protein [Suicoccus acidiformans]AXY25010.1 hypothetical protein CL176_02640 [Suicoccus acidiformans]
MGEETGFAKGEQRGIERGIEKGERRGIAKGEQIGMLRTRKQMFTQMIHQGFTAEDIAAMFNSPVEVITDLIGVSEADLR